MDLFVADCDAIRARVVADGATDDVAGRRLWVLAERVLCGHASETLPADGADARRAAERVLDAAVRALRDDASRLRGTAYVTHFPRTALGVAALELAENRERAMHALPPLRVPVHLLHAPKPCLVPPPAVYDPWQVAAAPEPAAPALAATTVCDVRTAAAFAAMEAALAGERQLALSVRVEPAAAYTGLVGYVFLAAASAPATVYALDALAAPDLVFRLGPLLASTRAEKVVCGSDGVRALFHEFGVFVVNVLDVEAARDLCGCAADASALFRDAAGVDYIDLDDWLVRPLPPRLAARFAHNTAVLPAVAARVRSRCAAAGLAARALVQAARECAPGGRAVQLRRIVRSAARRHGLGRDQAARLARLALWRERVARDEELHPAEVVGIGALVAVVAANAQTLAEVAEVVPDSPFPLLFGEELLRAIAPRNTAPFRAPPAGNWLGAEGRCVEAEPPLVARHSAWRREQSEAKAPHDILDGELSEIERQVLRSVLVMGDEQQAARPAHKQQGEEVPETFEEIFRWSKQAKRTNRKQTTSC